MNILNKIITFFYALIIAISIAVVIILFYIFPQKNWQIRKTWAKFIRKICFYKIEIIGEFSEDTKMIILNHRSMLDIIALEDVYPKNLCWIAKKQIGDLFFYGQIIKKPKMISIDRANARDFVNVIKQAKERLEDNRVISIFPEGTRNDTYNLLRFKSGASKIAEKLNISFQPIVLIGAKEILDSKKIKISFFKTLKIIILPPTNDIEEAKEMMQKVLNDNTRWL
ncbi:lysophospholipid acyltransferase family protein [Campylobacter canadensis]|nr:lysophospholipid acyltransferase family protein [Campylobacter canadensis]MBZ8003201.1 1-acyl-sn-glycerol-3-phosphate acyltransferase [Campylobacter canadensis]